MTDYLVTTRPGDECATCGRAFTINHGLAMLRAGRMYHDRPRCRPKEMSMARTKKSATPEATATIELASLGPKPGAEPSTSEPDPFDEALAASVAARKAEEAEESTTAGMPPPDARTEDDVRERYAQLNRDSLKCALEVAALKMDETWWAGIAQDERFARILATYCDDAADLEALVHADGSKDILQQQALVLARRRLKAEITAGPFRQPVVDAEKRLREAQDRLEQFRKDFPLLTQETKA